MFFNRCGRVFSEECKRSFLVKNQEPASDIHHTDLICEDLLSQESVEALRALAMDKELTFSRHPDDRIVIYGEMDASRYRLALLARPLTDGGGVTIDRRHITIQTGNGAIASAMWNVITSVHAERVAAKSWPDRMHEIFARHGFRNSTEAGFGDEPIYVALSPGLNGDGLCRTYALFNERDSDSIHERKALAFKELDVAIAKIRDVDGLRHQEEYYDDMVEQKPMTPEQSEEMIAEVRRMLGSAPPSKMLLLDEGGKEQNEERLAQEGWVKLNALDGRENVRTDNGVTVPDSRIAAMADYTPPEVLKRRPRNVPVTVDNGYDYWRD